MPLVPVVRGAGELAVAVKDSSGENRTLAELLRAYSEAQERAERLDDEAVCAEHEAIRLRGYACTAKERAHDLLDEIESRFPGAIQAEINQ